MDITEAFLQTALDALKQDILSALHVAVPGNIISYDPASGTAAVQPALRRTALSGELLTAPPLYEVPVLRPSAAFPVSEGDPCLLLFCDFCLDGWLTAGQPVLPPSPRQHDWSDAIALVGYLGGEASS